MASLKSGAVLRAIGTLFDRGCGVGASDAELLERFAADRDEAAFEALVVRHGRSVRAVCLHVLRDPHDAEDAFQATFLILARKAGSLWVGRSLSAWLHRVARRVAVEANRRKARRQAVEQTGLEVDAAWIDDRSPRESVGQLLHEEIDRLPEKYRAPIILCDLEELTRDQAAGRLGWPPGTVAGRLARARALLRDRLARRGEFDVPGVVSVTGLRDLPAGGVPYSWIGKTVRVVILSDTGKLASAAGAVLARGVLKAMLVRSLGRISLLSVVAVLATTACALAVVSSSSATPPQSRPAVGSATARDDRPSTRIPVSGSLAFPDGKPAAGVRIFYSTIDAAFDPARIRAEAEADDEGRFSLELPPVDGAWKGIVGSGALWAYRPGSYVPTIPVYRGALPPGSSLRLVVGPPAGALFEIHDPDGKPVVGARVEPRFLDRDSASVPDRLAALIGAESVTDARGRAVVAAFSQEEITSIDIVADGYGRQSFTFGHQSISPDPKIVRLRPAGRLKGRLVGDPMAIRRCPLSVFGSDSSEGTAQYGRNFETATDDEGRFEIPALAAGSYFVRAVQRRDFPWFARMEGNQGEVKPGQTTEVVLPLRRAVRVRGTAVERGTGKPVAGVRMAVTFFAAGDLTTGADGTCEGYLEPGTVIMGLRFVPPGYAMTLYSSPQLVIPEGAVEFKLPPWELVRAKDVLGKVVDDHARPAVGAEVEASWRFDETGRGAVLYRLSVRTGPDGRFSVPGVPEGVEVSLSARHRELRSPGPRSTVPGEAVILHLTEPIGVALTGRVLDPAGRPIVGASVHLRSQKRPPAAGIVTDDELVAFEDGPMLITDAEGRFRTPAELDRDGQYAAFVSAPGYLTSRTLWTAGHSGAFPVIRLRPVP